MHALFGLRFHPLTLRVLHRELRVLRCSASFGISNLRPLHSSRISETSRRRVIVQSSSELELEALRQIDVLERVKFGSVSRVFGKEELDTVLKQYPDSLVVLKCKAKYCRPCMAFAKKYTRLAEEYPDVLFLEIMGDETRETRMMMVDFEVKATPTFRYYRHEECIEKTVGIKLERIQETIEMARPPEHNL